MFHMIQNIVSHDTSVKVFFSAWLGHHNSPGMIGQVCAMSQPSTAPALSQTEGSAEQLRFHAISVVARYRWDRLFRRADYDG
jgi:hypothetical protein